MLDGLSREIMDAILETIPVELTVLDRDDRIVGWNERRHRIFKRPPEVIGRDVRECHSEKSLGLLDRLLREMKEGARDMARFWCDEKVGGISRKILVEYYALRDRSGCYVGCIEALQDIEGIRALEGEKRALE